MSGPSKLAVALVALVLACQVALSGGRRDQGPAAGHLGRARLDEPDELGAETLAVAAPVAGERNFQCEPIAFEFCAPMPFNLTRMPNFFGDSNQIEAAERAKQYERLARSRCSRHLLAYLCELLAPMCLEGEAMRKFEIYPCRSFCRHVRRECEHEILALAAGQFNQVPQAFACDQLPYQANGGAGELHGPCHETPDAPEPRPAGQANYWPYQPALDGANVPPFITDTSKIDVDLIRGRRPADARPPAAGQGLAGQVHALGQSLANALLRYSNLVSVATLLCLLVILNARRLNRLKAHLFGCAASSQSSSASSSGSQRKLAAPAGSPHAHKLVLSPSSSSRSLMLFAGNKQAPKHKLAAPADQQQLAQEPPQKLVHAVNQKTLINVDGTFERHQNRYQLMRSMAGAQAAQHEYDYIQVTGAHGSLAPSSSELDSERQFRSTSTCSRQPAAEHQLYKNILLSSPSHQVLLFADQAGARAARRPAALAPAAQPGQPRHQYPGPAAYAAPMGQAYQQLVQQQQMSLPEHHQRSFSRPHSRRGSAGHRAGHAHSASSASSSASSSSFSPPSLAAASLQLSGQSRRPQA